MDSEQLRMGNSGTLPSSSLSAVAKSTPLDSPTTSCELITSQGFSPQIQGPLNSSNDLVTASPCTFNTQVKCAQINAQSAHRDWRVQQEGTRSETRTSNNKINQTKIELSSRSKTLEHSKSVARHDVNIFFGIVR
ncbi:hypothetical protein BDR06DRAFT_995481 [Suillus hirtellus]|nr:hypothetical protein BDR06DRAFT_995481 [Suillus hirtellus]